MARTRKETRGGVPADYQGDDPELCNAMTKSGFPCRSLGIPPSGRCKWHAGLNGPAAIEEWEEAAKDFRERRKLLKRVDGKLANLGRLSISPTSRTHARTRE